MSTRSTSQKRSRGGRPSGGRPSGGRPNGGESARNARLRAEAAARAAVQRRRRLWVVTAVVAVAVVVVALGIVIGPRLRGPAAPLTVPETVPAAEREPLTLEPGRPVVLAGTSTTPVLTIWADFSCPHCADFARDYGPVVDEAVNGGRLRVELAPLAFVADGSAPAANAFACAAVAGFGPAYHDALYASFRDDWDDETLLALGEQVSPGAGDGFARCVAEDEQQPYVESVDAAADTAQITATPTVLLDGEPLDLAQTTPAVLAERLQEIG